MINKISKFGWLILIVYLTRYVSSEYISQDEPDCIDSCQSSDQTCLSTYLKFYSYKLVKSMFNFAKICVYAGLWATRYETPDETLFEKTFNETLLKYNDSLILGSLQYQEFEEVARFVYDELKVYTRKRTQGNELKYESYPSLRCPVPCNYELITWQTLFYISLTIFILALVTILFYSVFLRRQYVSLRNRLKNAKNSKVNSELQS